MRVSTIIPTYNCEATLAQAIDSALAQEIDGHEVIVVNDGSTDGSAAIIARYGNKIRQMEHPNRGFNRSRNPAAAIAQGEYLAFLDADDFWLPGRLELTCAALDRNPHATLAFGDVIPLNEDGTRGAPWVIGRAPSLTDLFTRGWRIYPSAVTIRRSAFVACGGFNEQLTNFSDMYLWMRARELGVFEYVTEPLTIYRTLEFSRVGDKYSGGRKAFARAVRNRYGRAVRPLAAEMDRVLASSLLAKAVMQRDRGEILPACRSVVRATWRSPRFLLQCGLVPHLLGRSNRRRVSGTQQSTTQRVEE